MVTNSLMLVRPIDGEGKTRTRRYARLVGVLTSIWSARIARTMGLPERSAVRAGFYGRAIATQRVRGDAPADFVRQCPAQIQKIVDVAEGFVRLIDPLDDEPVTPNAALRSLYEEPRFDRSVVIALAAQFQHGPSLFPVRREAA